MRIQTYNPSCTPVSKRRRGGTAGLIDSMVANRLATSTSDEEDSADDIIYQGLKRYLSEDVIDRKKRLSVRVMVKMQNLFQRLAKLAWKYLCCPQARDKTQARDFSIVGRWNEPRALGMVELQLA